MRPNRIAHFKVMARFHIPHAIKSYFSANHKDIFRRCRDMLVQGRPLFCVYLLHLGNCVARLQRPVQTDIRFLYRYPTLNAFINCRRFAIILKVIINNHGLRCSSPSYRKCQLKGVCLSFVFRRNFNQNLCRRVGRNSNNTVCFYFAASFYNIRRKLRSRCKHLYLCCALRQLNCFVALRLAFVRFAEVRYVYSSLAANLIL